VLVLLSESYREEWVPKSHDGGEIQQAVDGEKPPEGYEARTVLRFTPRMAPTKVAVFPLLKNKPELVRRAEEVHASLRGQWSAFYDEVGAIGRRYRRQDEVGTPFCVTIDFETLETGTVTVRDRDTMAQVRIATDALDGFLREKIES
jgi:glycyl-tRNA synthetase